MKELNLVSIDENETENRGSSVFIEFLGALIMVNIEGYVPVAFSIFEICWCCLNTKKLGEQRRLMSRTCKFFPQVQFFSAF